MLDDKILLEAKKLYNDFKEYIKNADNDEEIVDLCEKKSNYRVVNVLHDDYSILNEDKIVINISTNNAQKNALQGIKIYIDIDNLKLSKYIDIFLVNDEYPWEMIEIEKELILNKNTKDILKHANEINNFLKDIKNNTIKQLKKKFKNKLLLKFDDNIHELYIENYCFYITKCNNNTFALEKWADVYNSKNEFIDKIYIEI